MSASYRIALGVEASSEDEVVAELWALGTEGVHVREDTAIGPGHLCLEAYFAGEIPAEVHAFAAARGLAILGEEPVPEVDWLARYRESAQPFAVGARLWLDPREPEDAAMAADAAQVASPADSAPDGRIHLRLPARAAFGTGSHESTRLALELLERVEFPRPPAALWRALEVGAGTGVLSLAALAFGAAGAVAFDLDPAAPFHARDNARLNGRGTAWSGGLVGFAGRLAALAPAARFDLLLVNVLPEEILAEFAELVAKLAPAGELILSGILRERGAEMLAVAARFGLAERDRAEANEWVAFSLCHRSAPLPAE